MPNQKIRILTYSRLNLVNPTIPPYNYMTRIFPCVVQDKWEVKFRHTICSLNLLTRILILYSGSEYTICSLYLLTRILILYSGSEYTICSLYLLTRILILYSGSEYTISSLNLLTMEYGFLTKKRRLWISKAFLIRKSLKGYRCKSDMALYKRRLTCNDA